jgi:hypothetical protein
MSRRESAPHLRMEIPTQQRNPGQSMLSQGLNRPTLINVHVRIVTLGKPCYCIPSFILRRVINCANRSLSSFSEERRIVSLSSEGVEHKEKALDPNTMQQFIVAALPRRRHLHRHRFSAPRCAGGDCSGIGAKPHNNRFARITFTNQLSQVDAPLIAGSSPEVSHVGIVLPDNRFCIWG